MRENGLNTVRIITNCDAVSIMVRSYTDQDQHTPLLQENDYANPNPSPPSLIASNSCCRSISYDVYWGKSIWLKPVCACGLRGKCQSVDKTSLHAQVCAWGNRDGSPYARWMENLCTPCTPCKSTNPPSGTREVPVAKLKTLALSSRLNDFNARHHQTITGSELAYPLYSVAARHSSTSMSGVPEISNSTSCSLN